MKTSSMILLGVAGFLALKFAPNLLGGVASGGGGGGMFTGGGGLAENSGDEDIGIAPVVPAPPSTFAAVFGIAPQPQANGGYTFGGRDATSLGAFQQGNFLTPNPASKPSDGLSFLQGTDTNSGWTLTDQGWVAPK